ncbi:MAG: hypothetical protein FD161_70 [Limisphaerales bacterium]|nr:MAG: hypothetical protein FD161_70 [Limisphaerales bacterium]KAG0510516.1 MAG: hypothetical protein E1N63_70 [Limisphaerales bacterium]TXT52789.1 MAG: hypothetical protein FD140_332 [Limisphaerales bacterium]
MKLLKVVGFIAVVTVVVIFAVSRVPKARAFVFGSPAA